MSRPFGYHITGGQHLGSNLIATIDAGFTAAQIFLGPPQRSIVGSLPTEEVEIFIKAKKESGIKVYVHAPYVLHLFAKPVNKYRNDHEIAKMVRVASDLGCDGFVLHMGGTKWYEEDAQSNAPLTPKFYYGPAVALLEGLKSLSCPVLFENCASGNHMSGGLSSIRGLLDLLHEGGFTNTGLCLDTCHAWAWGFDLQDEDVRAGIIKEVTRHLKLIHLNSAPDKVTCGGKYDRHESIDKGVISKVAFQHLLRGLPDIPVIVERDLYQDVLSDWEHVKTADTHLTSVSTNSSHV